MRSFFSLACCLALVGCAAEQASSSSSDPTTSSSISSQESGTVQGLLAFAPGAAAPAATAKVRVVDVTFADAPSIEVAAVSVALSGSGPHAFTIPVNVRPGVRYAVQAHVDVDGDGETSKGDFITMESFPVFNGYPSTVEITVKRVD